MDKSDRTRELIIEHCNKYKGLTLQDLFKFLYQSSFGCEHLLGHRNDVVEFLRSEYKAGGRRSKNIVEPLDGNYSRVHLGIMNDGLSAETFGALFVLSAKREEKALSDLVEKLKITWDMILAEELPFSEIELTAAAKIWRKKGYPPLHHSETFRSLYHPSYRLLSNRFVPFLPIFCAIDKALKKGHVTLAIDGGAASGKTTLAELLQKVYACSVIHVDDYFLRPEQRTEERLREIGGNFDRERFTEEVLTPLSHGEDALVRPFDCRTGQIGEEKRIKKTPLTVIEGAYSMHPELSSHYTMSVFLDVSPELQEERITNRNSPEMAQRFFGEWIPKEREYFENTDAKGRSSLTVFVG